MSHRLQLTSHPGGSGQCREVHGVKPGQLRRPGGGLEEAWRRPGGRVLWSPSGAAPRYEMQTHVNDFELGGTFGPSFQLRGGDFTPCRFNHR